jgi:hypothetical protein
VIFAKCRRAALGPGCVKTRASDWSCQSPSNFRAFWATGVRESPKIVLSAAVFWQDRSFHTASVDSGGSTADQRMTAPGAERKCWHGALPAAIQGISEIICSQRAFCRLTPFQKFAVASTARNPTSALVTAPTSSLRMLSLSGRSKLVAGVSCYDAFSPVVLARVFKRLI